MVLIAGQMEPFHQRVKTGVKGAGAIFSGAILVADTALTPDGWKIAGLTGVKPFGVLVNGDAATGDTRISVCLEGEVNVIAGAAIQPNVYVMLDGAVAGRVKTWDAAAETTKVGFYAGDKDGTNTPAAAADGDVIRIIKEAD